MSDEMPQQVLLSYGTVGLEDPVEEMLRVEQVLPLRLRPPGHAAVGRVAVGATVVPVVNREAVSQQLPVRISSIVWLKVLFPPPPADGACFDFDN